jgi:MFS family permease
MTFATRIKNYVGEYAPLRHMRKEFWTTQAVTFVQAFSYFLFAQFFKIFLTQDCGFSAIEAGWTASFFATGMAIGLIIVGALFDQIGCRKATKLGSALVTVARLGIGLMPLMLSAGTKPMKIAIIGMMAIALVGEGIMGIIPSAGTRLFSAEAIRPIAFNAWYLIMNVAGILSGLVLEYLRNPDGGNSSVMFVVSATGFLGIIVARWYKDETPEELTTKADPSEKRKNFLTLLKEASTESTFWRLLLFLAVVIAIRGTFVLPMYLYPEYYMKVLGEDAHLGFLNSANPTVIVLGIFFLSPLIKRFNIYWTMVVGMFIATASMFVMAVPPKWWISWGVASNGENAYYLMILLQIVLYAVGEFIFSPQMQNYITSIPPPEKVGTYSGLARLPDVAAKMIVTGASGYLLTYYCTGTPQQFQNDLVEYGRSPEMLNLLLALIVMTSPILCLIFKKTFYVEKKAEV